MRTCCVSHRDPIAAQSVAGDHGPDAVLWPLEIASGSDPMTFRRAVSISWRSALSRGICHQFVLALVWGGVAFAEALPPSLGVILRQETTGALA